MMTSQQIEEMIDAHDGEVAGWAEKVSSLQMDLDQEKHEKSVLVRQMARAYALLDTDPDIDHYAHQIQLALESLWAGLFEVCGDKTVDEIIAKEGAPNE